MMEDLLGLKKFQLVGTNIRVMEQLETQRLMNAGREQLDTEMQVDAGLVPEEI
jgi:hypothetical protein